MAFLSHDVFPVAFYPIENRRLWKGVGQLRAHRVRHA